MRQGEQIACILRGRRKEQEIITIIPKIAVVLCDNYIGFLQG